MRQLAFKDIGKRVLVAAVGGPLVVAAAWFGGLSFLTLVILIILGAATEFNQLLTHKNSSPIRPLVLIALLGLCLIVYLQKFSLILPLTTLLLIVAITAEAGRPANNALLNVAGTLLTYAYIGGLMVYMIALRELPSLVGLDYQIGGQWLVTLLLAIWICDSAAYFVGSRFGKRKLAPRLSPNKTIEGALGGVAGGVLATWGCQLTFASSLTSADVVVLGLIVGVLGQLSDLIESLFKRDAGVKDTSSLLPGHGGILDRFDSEMLVMPVVYFYFLF